ncbi:MAG: 1,4-dihydroxy-2-naphthoate polyprenyltransferase [Deltaproteobacteria bacterium]|nr:1,4-dihydroxy-2-naphthoate polyprenyltransferase [Deltaproteobacteria bacterium]
MTAEVLEARPSRLRVWLLACRPATLTVALVPVLVGVALAHARGLVRPWSALAALLGAVLIQVGTNLANDVFDHLKGADTAERLGPLRVTQAGLLSPREVLRGMALAFGLATALGVYLVWVGGWVVVCIGVASIASGVAYTGGPYPLGYHGLGDLFVFVFFGPVAVCGTLWVAHGAVPWEALVASVPVGALASAVLVVNNTRDHETDVKAGKRTLVVRLGRSFGVGEYAALLAVAFLVPGLFLAWGRGFWVLLPWLTAPWALALARGVARAEGRALNPLLGATARLLLVFGALFAAGLAAR